MNEEQKQLVKMLSQNFRQEATIWYQCDPAKNTECKKQTCYCNPLNSKKAGEHLCTRTSKMECAVINENGSPIVVDITYPCERR